MADKALGEQVQAFVDFVGIHLVRHAQRGDSIEKGLLVGDGGAELRVGVPSQSRRAWHGRADQPLFEALELRVHRQQLVQGGRAGAGNAGDHQRGADRHCKTIRPLPPTPFGPGAADQQAQDRPRQLLDIAGIHWQVGADGIHQRAKSFGEPVAEIVHAAGR